jgi:mannose-6-phosphate isomerase-like protein (cupin superfamily)
MSNHPTQQAINIAEKLDLIKDHWNPRIVGQLNGQDVRLAKIKGEFIWHSHENEDEMFLVVRGVLKMELRDRTVIINEGEFFIVPRGTEHKPVAESEEVSIMLFEPSGTLNTGNHVNERTRTVLETV